MAIQKYLSNPKHVEQTNPTSTIQVPKQDGNNNDNDNNNDSMYNDNDNMIYIYYIIYIIYTNIYIYIYTYIQCYLSKTMVPLMRCSFFSCNLPASGLAHYHLEHWNEVPEFSESSTDRVSLYWSEGISSDWTLVYPNDCPNMLDTEVQRSPSLPNDMIDEHVSKALVIVSHNCVKGLKYVKGLKPFT